MTGPELGRSRLAEHTASRILCVSVGAAATEETRGAYARVRAALDRAGCGAVATIAVRSDADVTQAVTQAARTQADVLCLVSLSGRSAPLQVAVGLPAVIWAVGREYAFPSSALAVGALRPQGCPVALFHGTAEDGETLAGVVSALRAGAAVTRLRRARIGLVGGLYPNLVSCRYEPSEVTQRLGAALVPISYDRLREEMQQASRQTEDLLRLQEQCCRLDVRVPREALLPGLHLHQALAQVKP